MSNIKWANIDVYRAQVGLFIGPKDDFLVWCETGIADKELLKDLKESFGNVFQGITIDCGAGNSMIYLPEYNTNTLIHEIFHAVFYLLQGRDIPLTENTQESYAYVFEYIYDQLKK